MYLCVFFLYFHAFGLSIGEVVLHSCSGDGDPSGIKSPFGDGDGEKTFPVSLHGDGEIFRSRGRGLYVADWQQNRLTREPVTGGIRDENGSDTNGYY